MRQGYCSGAAQDNQLTDPNWVQTILFWFYHGGRYRVVCYESETCAGGGEGRWGIDTKCQIDLTHFTRAVYNTGGGLMGLCGCLTWERGECVGE